MRGDASEAEDPRFEAPFETPTGLIMVYDEHHERGAEEAWRGRGPARKVNVGRAGSGRE